MSSIKYQIVHSQQVNRANQLRNELLQMQKNLQQVLDNSEVLLSAETPRIPSFVGMYGYERLLAELREFDNETRMLLRFEQEG